MLPTNWAVDSSFIRPFRDRIFTQGAIKEMFIKQVTVEGFTSYKEAAIFKSFGQKLNVLLGLNCSGKSNFFKAIEFVLSNEKSCLSKEQRDVLLYKDGEQVTTAYVEIIFDNSDGRVMKSGPNEVTLRRTISLETNTLLGPSIDSFLRSYPCVYVEQEKVKLISTATASKRLELLQEFFGIRVLKERREKAQNNMMKATDSMAIVNILILDLDSLQAQEKAKAGEQESRLSNFQKWNEVEMSLEYCIIDTQLKKHQNELKELEGQKKNAFITAKDLSIELHRVQDELLEAFKTALKALKDREEAELKRFILSSEQWALATLGDIFLAHTDKMKAEEAYEIDILKNAEKELDGLEKHMERVASELQEVQKQEGNNIREISLIHHKSRILNAKLQSTSKDMLDQWIQKEIKQVEDEIHFEEEQRNKSASDLEQEIDVRISEVGIAIEEGMDSVMQLRSQQTQSSRYFYQMKRRESQLQSKLSELKVEQLKLEWLLTVAQENLSNTDAAVLTLMGKSIFEGHKSVHKVLTTFRDRGDRWKKITEKYYNTVYENLENISSSPFLPAVIATAGELLHVHIVESQQVGKEIMREIRKQKLPGQITFIGLNEMKVTEYQYPNADLVSPLLPLLTYEPRFDNVMRYLFGRTLLCGDLNSAFYLADYTHLFYVTMDGIKVTPISYTVSPFNKIRHSLELSDSEHKVRNLEEKLEEMMCEVRDTEAQFSAVAMEIRVTIAKCEKLKDDANQLLSSISQMKDELHGLKRSRISKERSLALCLLKLEVLRLIKEELEKIKESGSDFNVVRKQLLDELVKLEQKKKELNSEVEVFKVKIKKLENLLKNLTCNRDSLIQGLKEVMIYGRNGLYENVISLHSSISLKKREVQEKIEAIDPIVKEAIEEEIEVQSVYEEIKKKEEITQKNFNEHLKIFNDILSTEKRLKEEIDLLKKEITEVNYVPSFGLIPEYQSLDLKTMFEKLTEAKNNLKAFDQDKMTAFAKFKHTLNTKKILLGRKAELDEYMEKVQETLTKLEAAMTQAYLLCLKKLAEHFTEVFQKMIPQGNAELLVHYGENGAIITPTDSAFEEITSANAPTGICMNVSFTSTATDEMKNMNELSEYDKSLVALALIFAIQKCDPAPFYFLDDIDLTLFEQHGKGVADIIHEMSETSQIFISTSTPELLRGAQQVYLVGCKKERGSSVKTLSEEEINFYLDGE